MNPFQAMPIMQLWHSCTRTWRLCPSSMHSWGITAGIASPSSRPSRLRAQKKRWSTSSTRLLVWQRKFVRRPICRLSVCRPDGLSTLLLILHPASTYVKNSWLVLTYEAQTVVVKSALNGYIHWLGNNTPDEAPRTVISLLPPLLRFCS